jgi:hypothetical protein
MQFLSSMVYLPWLIVPSKLSLLRHPTSRQQSTLIVDECSKVNECSKSFEDDFKVPSSAAAAAEAEAP